MGISNDLIKKFVQITKDQSPVKHESTVYGTAVEYNGSMYVQLDGSELLTPVDTSTEIADGERVTVLIKDHTATVTGNLTNPSAGSNIVVEIQGDLDDIGDQITEFEVVIADKVSTKDFEANNAVINNLLAGKADVNKLTAVEADIRNLQAEDATIKNLVADKADIDELNATKADIEKLEAGKADIGDLNAAVGNITDLTADIAKIALLIGGNASIDAIQSIILTSQNTSIENALIKNAMIDNITADKISSGTINTNKVNIQSEDGGIEINGSTQQFKDQNGTVRVQIGKDAQGNFTFCLFSQDGSGILLDHEGIKAGAVPDGLIVNDMVADNANISGGKLDISSVVTEINNNSTTIKSSLIQFDDSGQSLLVAFNSLKDTVEEISEVTIDGDLSGVLSQIQTLSTQLEVAQGQIDTLITNTTIITENGEAVLLKDDYTQTKQTVSGISTKVGSLETEMGDSFKEVSDNYSELEQTLFGFESTVSSTYATKQNLSNGLENIKNDLEDDFVSKTDYEEFTISTNSSIEQTKSDVNIKFESTTEIIQSINGQLTELRSNVETSIGFNENGMTIGRNDSPFSVNVDNNKLSFRQESKEVAYISNDEMKITDANVQNSLTLGSFKFFPRTTGNLSLVWDDNGNIIPYANAYPNVIVSDYIIHRAEFSSPAIPMDIYTIEICGDLGDREEFNIYNPSNESNAKVEVLRVYNTEFRNGVARKSFLWCDIDSYGNVLGGNTGLHVYVYPYEGSVVHLSYIKLIPGDEYWTDYGNLLSYNNVFTEAEPYILTALYEDHYTYTGMYAYLEAGKTYEFTCKHDKPWRDEVDSGMDYCEGYIYNLRKRADGTILDSDHIRIDSDTFRFTVPTTERWGVRLDANVTGQTYKYWDIKIVEIKPGSMEINTVTIEESGE